MIAVALYLLLGCLGLFGLLLLWDGLVALRHTTQVVEAATRQFHAPYPTAPVEMRVTGQSFEEFIAVECARVVPEPER
jgi:hypothetical protein